MFARTVDGTLPQQLAATERIRTLFRKLEEYHQRHGLIADGAAPGGPLGVPNARVRGRPRGEGGGRRRRMGVGGLGQDGEDLGEDLGVGMPLMHLRDTDAALQHEEQLRDYYLQEEEGGGHPHAGAPVGPGARAWAWARAQARAGAAWGVPWGAGEEEEMGGLRGCRSSTCAAAATKEMRRVLSGALHEKSCIVISSYY